MNNSYNIQKFIFITIIIILLIIIYIYLNNKIEKFNNIVIPLDIYQTWHTKELPPKMRECVDSLIKDNPEFNHHLYDDDDCREFIKNNFNDDVLNAYDSLIPGAYKADLWRYCILYKKGGIYLDIQYECINNFKLINFTNNEYFVKDIDNNDLHIYNGVYNAFMICKPANNKCLKCINEIINNVKNNNYCNNYLEVTGPQLLKKFFNTNEYNNLKFKLNLYYHNNIKYISIFLNDKEILRQYLEYRNEQKKFSKKKHYVELWNNKNIYY